MSNQLRNISQRIDEMKEGITQSALSIVMLCCNNTAALDIVKLALDDKAETIQRVYNEGYIDDGEKSLRLIRRDGSLDFYELAYMLKCLAECELLELFLETVQYEAVQYEEEYE